MTTKMRQEITEIPRAAAYLLETGREAIAEAGAALARRDPAVLVTIARGSSDHAAHFLKYAVELELGLPVASLGPSLASIYDVPLKLDRAAAIAVLVCCDDRDKRRACRSRREASPPGILDPLAQKVGIDPMRKRKAGYRHTRLKAGRNKPLL